MSLDDYINRVPDLPPKVNFEEQQSSLDEDYPPLDPGRAHLTNSVASNRPGNSTIPRFSLPYWTALQTGDGVATLLPNGADQLTLTSVFRTNKDRTGFVWSSKDTLAHQITSYVENVNYQNVVLAFQHNTDHPDQFTCSITNSVGTFLYRLVPYALNSVTNVYECLDKKFGTGKTYPATVYDRTKPNIDGVTYGGRTNYIFILDFNDLRQAHNFTGDQIDPRKVSSIVLDVLPPKHGLGDHAFVARVFDHGDGTSQMELGGVEDTAKLVAGDVLTGLLTYVSNTESQFVVNTRWVVIDSIGFGTSNRSLLVQGSTPGGFIDFPVLYARDLQNASVTAVTNKTHILGNLTLTGLGTKTMGKRTYSQGINGLGMVSSLDQDHTMQPKRLVDSVVALGYRQDWNLSLGSSAYFQGSTTLQKTGVAAVTDGQANEWPVLYAGEAQLNGQYVVGRAPTRGIDKLHDDVSASWGSNYAAVMPFNGTTLNSSVETAGMPVGGSYWWDLELNLPGPAALAAVAAMRGRTPKGIVWCLGDSDATAIDSPGNRMPVPTIARAKTATVALFAYFRGLWGDHLPIWIQEQAWGWVGTDPVDPNNPGTNVPVQKGAPTYLRVRRTAFGDLLFEWKSYDLDPALASFRVEIYNPVKIGQVLTTFVVNGNQEDNGYIYADWSIEDNGPIRALIDTGNDYWGGIRWRVVSISALGQIPSVTMSGLVPIDNTLVERVIVCGPNLYLGNYFTDVSDPTHGVDRRDLQAMTVMRTEYALKAGLRRLKVMPLNVSDEDRGDEDTEIDDQKFGRILKDWWNLDLGFPGSSLVAAIAKVNALGPRPVAHFVLGQPGELELMRTMEPADVFVQLGKLRDANVAMLAFLRTVWSNPTLCMWMQGATSIWMGMPTVEPMNINAVSTLAMRRSQSDQCLGSPDFYLGSYVPGGDTYTNFQVVGLERKYPTPATYNTTAKEMGESMALLIDRAVNDSDCPDMVLVVDPQFAFSGAGFYALYGAPNNNVWSQTGSVNITNNRLAYLLVSGNAGFVYGNQTAIGIWGTPDRQINAVQIAKNAEAPITIPLTFVEVPNSPYDTYTGQWQGVLPNPAFVMTADDEITVTISSLCDHDTGPGCDDPILVWVEGMPYDVRPLFVTADSGWVSQWASQNSGLWGASGSIGPNDFLGFVQVTPGVSEPGGSTLYPNTSIVRWGKGDEGFTTAVISYKGNDYTFPLTWTAAPSPQGAGVWQYAAASVGIDMSTGGDYKLTFNGGIAGKRQIEVCSYCVGCATEETYTEGPFVFTSGTGLGDQPISIISYDWLENTIKEYSETMTCDVLLSLLAPTGTQAYNHGVIGDAGMDLAATALSVTSYEGDAGGFTARFSMVMGDGRSVDGGWLTCIRSASGTTFENHLIGGSAIQFGTAPDQVSVLSVMVAVTVGGTEWHIEMPEILARDITDPACLLGNWVPVCCHFVTPPNPPAEGTPHYRTSALWTVGSAWIDGTIIDADGTNGPWLTSIDRVSTGGASSPVYIEVALLDSAGVPLPEDQQIAYTATTSAASAGGTAYALRNADVGNVDGVPGGSIFLWGGALLTANRTVTCAASDGSHDPLHIEVHYPQPRFTWTCIRQDASAIPAMGDPGIGDKWDSCTGVGSAVFDAQPDMVSNSFVFKATGTNKRSGPNYTFTIYNVLYFGFAVATSFEPSGVSWIDDNVVFAGYADGAGGAINAEATVYCDWDQDGVPHPGPAVRLLVNVNGAGPYQVTRYINFSGRSADGGTAYASGYLDLDMKCTPVGIPV